MSNIAKITTGKAKLEWVTITGEGKENLSGKMQYVANAVVPEDSPVVQQIKEYWEANKPAGFKREAKSLGIYPYKQATDEKDEDGKVIYAEVPGMVYLAFKTGTTFPNGSPKKVQVYNAKGSKVELPEGTSIGNGSIGAISGAMGIYINKAPKGTAIVDAGVTLYLDAVQIAKLEEYSADAGFEAMDEEDGWTGEEGWTGEVEETTQAEASKPRL